MKKNFLHNLFIFVLFALIPLVKGQTINYSHADTLKGSITNERIWWNVLHYELHVSFNPSDSTIKGFNIITYKVVEPNCILQIDLMSPLVIDSIYQGSKKCEWKQNGDAYFIKLLRVQKISTIKTITVYYHGKPRRAKNAPWDGGIIWEKDEYNNPWVSIACQGMAGSAWYPCKDHQYDEPDSASVFITAPKQLVAVANGKLRSQTLNEDSTTTYNWAVVNPINNYNIIPYIGKYINFKDTFCGKGGLLDLDFWVLEGNLEKAQKQFKQVKPMLTCFEDWFGKYPFYEDGYKLVESPFLGMEHQSAIAYGNNFVNGYSGADLSSTGWGLKWDFIIIHESGHEWFGNNISAKDLADNWIHEGFTAYAENLYTEYLFGKKAGAEYVIGTRKEILNDIPIISNYNVNRDGSGDKYYKAANMLHLIRTIVNNDSLWKSTLQNMNELFWHQTVTSNQIENYLITSLRYDFQKVFDQYLRTTKIPNLEYHLTTNQLYFRWTNCVKDFNMPLRINDGENDVWLHPKTKWQVITYNSNVIIPDSNFYISSNQIYTEVKLDGD